MLLGLRSGPAESATLPTPLLDDVVPVPDDADLTPDEGPVEHPGARRIVYLNGDGGVYTDGWPDDSGTNRASVVIGDSANIPAWGYGDASWEFLLSCVRELFADYDVHVTDEDPGDAAHVECAVGGSPLDIGWPETAGGVAPAGCGIIEEAVVFVFSNVYDGNLERICWTAGQEVGHAYGLDHVTLCDDVMTYDDTCPDKEFTDVDADCGEGVSRPCRCGGFTQNSHRLLLDRLGPHPANVPPTVSILAPADGALVDPGFAIDVEASDDLAVDFVRLRLAGEFVENDGSLPYGFVAPGDLPAGPLRIEVDAVDLDGASATDSVTVTVRGIDGCEGGPDCADAAASPLDAGTGRRASAGCGCAAAGPGGWGAALATAIFLCRRRR